LTDHPSREIYIDSSLLLAGSGSAFNLEVLNNALAGFKIKRQRQASWGQRNGLALLPYFRFEEMEGRTWETSGKTWGTGMRGAGMKI
jgi:hypothetical protein